MNVWTSLMSGLFNNNSASCRIKTSFHWDEPQESGADVRILLAAWRFPVLSTMSSGNYVYIQLICIRNYVVLTNITAAWKKFAVVIVCLNWGEALLGRGRGAAPALWFGASVRPWRGWMCCGHNKRIIQWFRWKKQIIHIVSKHTFGPDMKWISDFVQDCFAFTNLLSLTAISQKQNCSIFFRPINSYINILLYHCTCKQNLKLTY